MDYIEEEILAKIGAKIVSRRKQLNLTQEDLAYSADIDRTYVGYVENGKQNITISMLVKFANALDLVLKDFVSWVFTDLSSYSFPFLSLASLQGSGKRPK